MVLTGLNKNIATQQIKDRVLLLIEVMQDSIRQVVNEDNAEFNQVAKDITDNIITIITSNNIFESLAELFSAYDLVGQTPNNRLKLATNLFSFGEAETQIVANPDLANSLDSINKAVQEYAMSLGYNNAAQIQYGNTDELNEVVNSLDAEFQRLVSDPNNNSDTRVAILDLKTNTFNFFSQLDLAEIINIRTTTLPSLVLSYTNYGSSQFSDEIVELNQANNTAFIEGEIRIISSNDQ